MTGTAKPKPELLLTEARADYSSGKWLEARTKFSAAQAVAALITDDLLALGDSAWSGLSPGRSGGRALAASLGGSAFPTVSGPGPGSWPLASSSEEDNSSQRRPNPSTVFGINPSQEG